MKTITLFEYIQSELIKQGFNEFVDDEGKLVFFDESHQFIRKIMVYDADVQSIVDDLFIQLTLNDPIHDELFKKNFIYRFINRQINRQTIESFQLELANTFLTQKEFINRLYEDIDLYLTNSSQSDQLNQQVNDGETTTDSRQAFADLPQSVVNLDVNDTTMETASDNTISKSRQANKQATDGTVKSNSKSYQLDQLVQSSGVMEQVFKIFDKKCFLQVF